MPHARPATQVASQRRTPTPLLVASLCGALGLTVGCGSLISNTQEVEIGKGVDQQIAKEYRLLDPADPVARWAVELVVPLGRASKPFRDPADIGGYRVAVIADDALLNAFAAPGGYTYLSTGLILAAGTCAEVAGVMGHELAHVTQRHGAKAIEKAFAAQQLAEFFLGGGTLAESAAVTIFGFLQATKFSREAEKEADSVGLRISHGAGYNPYGLARFFEALLEKEKKAGGRPPEFLSSHPATADRVMVVEGEINERWGSAVRPNDPARDACQATSLTFEQVKERIKAGNLRIRPGTGVGAKAVADAEHGGPASANALVHAH